MRQGDKIFSFTRDTYEWLCPPQNVEKNDSLSNIEIIKLEAVRDRESIPIRYIRKFKDRDSYSGGIIEPTNYSIFNVHLNIDNIRSLQNKEIYNKFLKLSEDMLEHFIRLYQWVSQEKDVYLPNISDCPIVEVLVSENGDINSGILNQTFKFHSTKLNWDNLTKKPVKKTPLSKEAMNWFSNLLKSGKELELYQKLLLDAKEQGHLNRKYDLAILKIGTAFEVFVQDRLLRACELKGIKKLPGKGKNAKEKDYKEAIINGNVREELLSIYLKEITGISIKGTKAYNEWYTNAYSIRNEIIHRGKTDVNDKDAEVAFNSTVKLIFEIEKKLSQAEIKLN